MSKRTGTGDAMLALPDRKWTRVDGERLVAAWQESGLSVREFARQHGIDGQRVQWWKRRIIGVAETKRHEEQGARFVPVIARRSADSPPAVIVRIGDVAIEVHEPSVVAPGWVAVVIAEYARKPA